MLLGRPYHTDAATGHCIDEVLSHLGLAVLAPNVLTKEDAPRVERSCNTSKSACVWKKASHMVRLAHYAVQHKRIDVVALHSFGCLYDSVNIIEVADYLHKHGRLFTALKVDEIADTAHVRIRLRTLAENIEQLGLAHTSAQNASANAGNSSAGNSSASNAESCERTAPASNAESCERTAPASNTEPCECIAPASNANTSNSQSAALAQPPAAKTFTAPLSPQLVRYAEHGSIKAFAHLCAADIEAARSHTRDLCYSTAAIVGRSLRILSSCPALVALTLPNVCHNCTLEAVPYLLERITGRALTITWENSWPLPPTAIDQPPAPAMPLVGILGTAPLVFDSYLNDHLASVITAHGCTPVFPECEALFTNDIQYLDQLQHFYDCGVRHVIYLQSFGCLKGHVHVRGSMHALAQRFPGMNLVVLDYDPEASALNRENRVLLTLAAALGI